MGFSNYDAPNRLQNGDWPGRAYGGLTQRLVMKTLCHGYELILVVSCCGYVCRQHLWFTLLD